MTLIELLENNFWILLLLLWLVFGAVSRMRKGPQEQEQEVPKPRQQSAPMDKPWEKIQDTQETVSVERLFDSDKKEADRTSRWIARNDLFQSNEGIEEPILLVKKKKKNKYRKLLDFNNMNEAQVIQGVIWSQVLGKPRSKEPHQTNRYSYYSRGKH